MVINSLKLDQFRNYEMLDLDFHPGTNVFFGENAQGKTNILESIYLCGTSRSHKGSRDKEMIRFGQEEAHICMRLERNQMDFRIDMHLKRNRTKGIAIGGVPVKKAGELIGIGNFIFFSPEDLGLIKNGPSERRRFLDMELCQLDRIYLFHLTSYSRALAQRNKLLKDIVFHPEYEEMLDVWDQQMVRYGRELIARREKFIKELNRIVYGIHRNLSGMREELTVSYDKNTGEEEFEKNLKKNREKDMRMHMTGCGPHRDDLCFTVQNIDIRRYGSQGQQRTAALSLKLAEIELVKRHIKDTPVLLLDDVLSELDANRQRYLLENIHDIQTFITCTGIDHFVENHFKIDRLFHVKAGTAAMERQSGCSSGYRSHPEGHEQ